MQTKILEIRDRATFIPVLAFATAPTSEAQRYLLARAGFADRQIIVLRLSGIHTAQYDPYQWQGGARTMPIAHLYIRENWDTLSDGDVIDVEFISGERKTKKQSERLGQWKD